MARAKILVRATTMAMHRKDPNFGICRCQKEVQMIGVMQHVKSKNFFFGFPFSCISVLSVNVCTN